MASLARAFTQRRTKNKSISDTDTTSLPQRSLTTKISQKIKRHEISAPLELVSTTNMLSYNAPDLYPSKSATTASSIASRSSGEDSSTRSPTCGQSTPISTLDSASINTGASSPISPEPNHLSCYFGGPSSANASGDEAPSIPKRAPSHTKKSHEKLSHARSMSTRSSRKNSISSRTSINMHSSISESIDVHPFGSELAQVSELAEEYGNTGDKLAEDNLVEERVVEVVDDEEREELSKGYCKFRAEDYINDISGYFLNAFSDVKPAAIWI